MLEIVFTCACARKRWAGRLGWFDCVGDLVRIVVPNFKTYLKTKKDVFAWLFCKKEREARDVGIVEKGAGTRTRYL